MYSPDFLQKLRNFSTGAGSVYGSDALAKLPPCQLAKFASAIPITLPQALLISGQSQPSRLLGDQRQSLMFQIRKFELRGQNSFREELPLHRPDSRLRCNNASLVEFFG